jgi:hypothetical protein
MERNQMKKSTPILPIETLEEIKSLNEKIARLEKVNASLLSSLKELVERRERAAAQQPYYRNGMSGSDGRYDRARAAIEAAEAK